MKSLKTLTASALIAGLAATAALANPALITDRDRAEGTAMQTVTTGETTLGVAMLDTRNGTVEVGRSVTLSVFGSTDARANGFANDLR